MWSAAWDLICSDLFLVFHFFFISKIIITIIITIRKRPTRMQDALNQKRVVFYFNPVSYECVDTDG